MALKRISWLEFDYISIALTINHRGIDNAVGGVAGGSSFQTAQFYFSISVYISLSYKCTSSMPALPLPLGNSNSYTRGPHSSLTYILRLRG